MKADIYPRHEIGFNFECELRDLVINNHFSDFDCNDLDDIQSWYRDIGKGVDFKFYINGVRIEAELKYLDERCYRSWVLRDYIPRFSFTPNSIPIVVCNNKNKISDSGREELKLKHIRIMNQYEFIWYLFNFSRKRGNKYVCYRHIINNNSSSAQTRKPEIKSNFTVNTIENKAERANSDKIKKHSLDHKNTSIPRVNGHARTTTKLQALLIQILLIAFLFPFLNKHDQSGAKLRNRLFPPQMDIPNRKMTLTSPISYTNGHVKYLLENNTSSRLCANTQQFPISDRSFEFYSNLPDLSWTNEYTKELIQP